MIRDERWDEYSLSEKPVLEQLQAMGYTYAPDTVLEEERETPRDVVLEARLAKAIKRLNPWITDDNLKKAVRRVTVPGTVGLMETNEHIYTDIVHYFSLEQDVGAGRKSQTVKLIDFDNLDNNEFLVTNQYHVWGPKENIRPDIVIFINGLPVVVIECKSPFLTEWKDKAIGQLRDYRDDRTGSSKLFNCNQILMAICGQGACYSTISGEPRHYMDWKDPWPRTIPEIEAELNRKPTPQEILIAGMLHRRNLFDLIQNFIVFEPEGGKTIKKLARYQQFRAVNRTLEKVLGASNADRRGGVIWHTQGSGKSLTMLWTAVKLRRIRALENPVILVVTDQIQLDSQIHSTFRRCGFPNPARADSVNDLRELLQTGRVRTIMTTVQKFLGREGEKQGEFPVLSRNENIFALVDEAHRTQYQNLATNMRTALPNACFIGFTGTPIDRRDRSTPRTFGPYIDKYTIEQSVEDGATIEIKYESRLPNVKVEGESLDEIFDRIFKDYSEKERVEIKKRYATEEAITGAPQRIEQICLDLVKHYNTHIAPNGFKAQIVAVNRRTAILYKEILDKLNGPESAVIISSSHGDPQEWAPYRLSKSEQDSLIERFKKSTSEDKLSILIVCDMLLTGFDAPVEQVLYLDSPLKEHNLLQAIARVNRPARNKWYGLIVDYFGVSDFLKKALAIFNNEDVKGVMTSLKDELPRLQTRHRTAMQFFEKVNRKDLNACITVLEQEDVRARFEVSFHRFATSMDMVMPDPAANPYRENLKFLGMVRNAARVRFRDETLNLAGCSEKVRKLIEEHIRSTGVDPLVAPISILDKNFHERLEEYKSDEARASEMEHALRHEINERAEEDPEFYRSLRERLENIIAARKESRVAVAQTLNELRDLINEARNVRKEAERLGFEDETPFAFYGILKAELPDTKEQNELTKLAVKVVAELKSQSVIDWTEKSTVQKKMRSSIKRLLKVANCPADRIEPLTLRLLDLARVRLKR